MNKIKAVCTEAKDKVFTNIQNLSERWSISGYLARNMDSPLFLQRYKIFKLQGLRYNNVSYKAKTPVTDSVKHDLNWGKIRLKPSSIKHDKPSIVVTSDASKKGLGGVMVGLRGI